MDKIGSESKTSNEPILSILQLIVSLIPAVIAIFEFWGDDQTTKISGIIIVIAIVIISSYFIFSKLYPEKRKEIKLIFIALPFVLSAALGLEQLWEANTEISIFLLIGFGLIGLLLELIVIFLRSTENPRILKIIKDNNIDLPVIYPKSYSRYSLIGIVTLLILSIVSIGYPVYQQQQPPTEFLVLVSTFENLTDQSPDNEITQIIIDGLSKAIEKEQIDIKVAGTKQIIKTSIEARKVGKKHKASIVIWGSYHLRQSVRASVNFEMLCNLNCPPDLPPEVEGKDKKIDLVKFQNFDYQYNLSDQMTYLSLLVAGIQLYEKENYSGAINRFTNAIEWRKESSSENNLEPSKDFAQIYLFRAYSYEAIDKTDEAIQDYTDSINIDPSLKYSYNYRGYLYYSKGNYELALKDIDQAIKIDPNIAEFYYYRGMTNVASENPDQAISDLNKAISLEPKTHYYYQWLGYAYSSKKDYAKAVEVFTKAIDIDPKNYYLYINRGDAYGEMNNQDQAIADYAKAIELNSKNADVFVARGQYYFSKKKYLHAIEDYSEAIKRDPKNAHLYYLHGYASYYQGDYDQTIKDFTKAIEIDPKNHINFQLRGYGYDGLKKYDKAIEDYNKAIELDPGNYYLYYNRGRSYQNIGNLDRAIEDLTKAIKLYSEDADVFEVRAQVYSSQKRYSDAIKDYTEAIKLEPENMDLYYNRGIAYENLPDIMQAIADFEKVALSNTNSSHIEDAQKHLDKLKK